MDCQTCAQYPRQEKTGGHHSAAHPWSVTLTVALKYTRNSPGFISIYELRGK